MTDFYTRQSTMTNGTTADATEVEAELVAIHSAFQQVSAAIAALGLGTLVPSPTLAKAGLPVAVTSSGAAFEIPTATAFLTALGLSANGKSLITAADYTAMKVLLAIAATNLVATQSNVLIGRATSGAGAFEEIALSAAGRALIDDANADAQLTTLGGTTAGKAIFTGATYAAIRGLLGIDGPVLLEPETSITAVSNIDFANIFAANSTYPYFKIVIEGMGLGGSTCYLRMSNDGSTFLAGASDYAWLRNRYLSDGTADDYLNDTADSRILLFTAGSTESCNAEINIHAAAGASDYTQVVCDATYAGSSGIKYHVVGALKAAATSTGFRLVIGAGTFAAQGKVRIYGSFRPFS